MHRKLTIATGIGAAVILTAAVGTWWAARRQQHAAAAMEQRLLNAPAGPQGRPASLEPLPPPVARYLGWALPDGLVLDAVQLVQSGSLRTETGSERWMTFTATQLVVPRATGFIWNARVAIAPLIHVRVRDALVAGTGSGQVDVMSAFTVSRAGGTPEMNSGSLHRYLAEAVWYPSALRPSATLKWTGIDAHRAIATLSDHGVSVALEFRFGDAGEVRSIYTPGRWGSFAGGYRQAAWEGHFGHYETHQGITVPMEGDVGWYVDGVWQPVWRGRIDAYSADIGREAR